MNYRLQIRTAQKPWMTLRTVKTYRAACEIRKVMETDTVEVRIWDIRKHCEVH